MFLASFYGDDNIQLFLQYDPTTTFTSPSFRQTPDRGPGQAPESSNLHVFWMPDQVRHDDFEIFYRIVKLDYKKDWIA